MQGKELLLAALRGERTPRPAWVPFVGVHGAHLIGRRADEYLRSPDLLVEGLVRARDLYQPDGLPVAFDLQLEAEILGCQLTWLEEVPPAVSSHPLASGSLEDLPPFDPARGRFPVVLEALDRLRQRCGDDVALYGLVCGPLTLALHLMGNDLFMDMVAEPERVARVVAHCGSVAQAAAEAYIDGGVDVVAVVDPMTSQIGPGHFSQCVASPLSALFDHVRSRRVPSSLFVCGDATRNLELMCDTGADNLSVDEQIDMADLRRLCLQRGLSFGGNIKLTSVLLLGDEDDARAEALEIIDACGDTGFVLAPGCDLPFAVPPANLQAIARLVHDEYERDVARSTVRARPGDTYDDVALPDYGDAGLVTVDVVTLDSGSCAPCQYMVQAAARAAERATCAVRLLEHKITAREGLGVMAKLGVRNLPTICIDGEVRFASIIPDPDTLVQALEERAEAKAAQARVKGSGAAAPPPTLAVAGAAPGTAAPEAPAFPGPPSTPGSRNPAPSGDPWAVAAS